MANSHDQDELEELANELLRQDAAWASAKDQLRAFEGCELRVPDSLFQEIDDACPVRASVPIHPGGLRA